MAEKKLCTKNNSHSDKIPEVHQSYIAHLSDEDYSELEIFIANGTKVDLAFNQQMVTIYMFINIAELVYLMFHA